MDLTKYETDMSQAAMLIGLGLTTIDAVISYFKQNGTDDATLDAIAAEVQTRLTRRS